MEDATRTMIANLPLKTGRSLDDWIAEIRGRKLEKHGEMMTMLKKEFGVTHGYANLIAIAARGGLEPAEAPSGDLEAAVFAGKREAVRPVWEAVRKAATGFGSDVEVAPKKAYVSLRRKKQFALAQPTTTRLDLGLILKDASPAGRLEAAGSFNSMCSHRVRLERPEDVDAEVVAWLREAYDAAG